MPANISVCLTANEILAMAAHFNQALTLWCVFCLCVTTCRLNSTAIFSTRSVVRSIRMKIWKNAEYAGTQSMLIVTLWWMTLLTSFCLSGQCCRKVEQQASVWSLIKYLTGLWSKSKFDLNVFKCLFNVHVACGVFACGLHSVSVHHYACRTTAPLCRAPHKD